MCIYISINDEKTKKQPFQPKFIYKKQPLMEALYNSQWNRVSRRFTKIDVLKSHSKTHLSYSLWNYSVKYVYSRKTLLKSLHQIRYN